MMCFRLDHSSRRASGVPRLTCLSARAQPAALSWLMYSLATLASHRLVTLSESEGVTHPWHWYA